MLSNRLVSHLTIPLLFSVGFAWAAGANSPEALAMAMANAHRSGNVGEIVALHHFVSTQNISVDEQRAIARREWRALLKQFQISGYRLSMLSAPERQQFSTTDSASLVPVKKLIITLVARHGEGKQTVNHYIGHVAGRYLFIEPKKQIKQPD